MQILEIGGGAHPNPKSTIRLDARYIPGKVDIVGDGANLSRFSDNQLDGIYARHVLEHWSHRRTEAVLREWYRVLRPGGTLEIHCPDLDKLVYNYTNHVRDSYTGKRFDVLLFAYYLYGGQEYPENTHKAGWNYLALRKLLSSVGFKQIERHKQLEDHIEMRITARK